MRGVLRGEIEAKERELALALGALEEAARAGRWSLGRFMRQKREHALLP